MRAYIDMIESILATDRAWFILPIPYLVHTSDPILSLRGSRGSIPDFGLVTVLLNDDVAAAVSGCERHSGSHAQPLGFYWRHGWRPCDTGSRRPCFICRDQHVPAVVLLCVAPRTRHRGTSSGLAKHLFYLGVGGHCFFPRRFASAMRRVCGQFGPKPCSSPGLGPMCITWCPRSLARS